MAYTSWSVVFGEQPSAAKWNILGTNDSSFNDGTGIADGAATKSNIYCFRAYDSGGTTLTDGAIVQINLATESYDYGSNFASSAYTVPINGVYHFDGLVTITGAIVTPVNMTAYVYVNGAGTNGFQAMNILHSVANSAVSISGDILLAAGAVVTLRCYQDSAGNEATTTTSAATFFSGHLVHAT